MLCMREVRLSYHHPGRINFMVGSTFFLGSTAPRLSNERKRSTPRNKKSQRMLRTEFREAQNSGNRHYIIKVGGYMSSCQRRSRGGQPGRLRSPNNKVCQGQVVRESSFRNVGLLEVGLDFSRRFDNRQASTVILSNNSLATRYISQSHA